MSSQTQPVCKMLVGWVDGKAVVMNKGGDLIGFHTWKTYTLIIIIPNECLDLLRD